MSNLEISRAKRLDQYVIEQFPERSRSFASQLIADGKVQVNGETANKAGYKLRPSDSIDITYNSANLPAIPDIEVPVIYEDDDCVVINKPTGLLAHSKGDFNPEPTVESWLRGRTSLTGKRAGIVHRLDRATSGVMICAKTPEAHSWLQKQFAQRRVKKAYIAIVTGRMTDPEAIIDMPIGRNPKAPQLFRVDNNGKVAQTAYIVLETHGDISLLELRPVTGRTHQLRVHLRHLGHPILGDTLYGTTPAERLFLHARELEITIPSRERKVFAAKVPKLFFDELQKYD